MDSQVDTSSMQVAKKPFQSSLARVLYKGKQYLDQLALGGQTVKNLFLLVYKFELDQSRHKSSQVHIGHDQMESQMNILSFQLAITCASLWPGLNSC